MPASSSRVSTTTVKPYSRLASSKSKGKAPAEFGAPAQHGQASRKGKRAWRKNVDVRGEEEALERAREEERITGGRIADKRDGELFTIDTIGDVEVAKKVRAKKPLRSLAVLSERSAVPSLTSRTTAISSGKVKVTSAEKTRMRRIARRTMDANASADVAVISTEDLRDAWDNKQEAALPLSTGGFGDEGMSRPPVRAPKTLARQRDIRLGQIASQLADEVPTAGLSYNPTAESHAQLISRAVEEELERLRKETAQEEATATLGQVVAARREALHYNTDDFVDGMRVGHGDESVLDNDTEVDGEESRPTPKPTKRKTQAQRNKTARAKETRRLAELEATKQRLHRSVGGASVVRKSVEAKALASEEARRLRRLAASQRERLGFEGGEKIGRHRVAKGTVAVQLGEDLAESLRQVKPEGNLFKDRFLSLQKRALLEPRVPQLPKRRTGRTKEYEKHAYKRFK